MKTNSKPQSIDDVIASVAAKHKVSPQKVRKDMQEHLDYCYNHGVLAKMGFLNGKKPSLEEWIALLAGKAMGMSKEMETQNKANFFSRHYN